MKVCERERTSGGVFQASGRRGRFRVSNGAGHLGHGATGAWYSYREW